MGHIDEQIGTDSIGNRAEAGEVPEPRIGGAARDDDLRLMLMGQALHSLHVDKLIFRSHAIADYVEPFAGHVRPGAMGEVATSGQIEAHECVVRTH